MHHILVIEDLASLQDYIQKGLIQEGFKVDCASNGAEGLHLALEFDYDCIVLDRMLPMLDGLSVLKALRSQKQTPVLMLTAKTQVSERVEGLQAGADDYLSKPFAFSELVARIHTLLRRPQTLQNNPQEATGYSVADLELNLLQRTVKRAGKAIALTPKEFTLLSVLLKNQTKVLSRTQLSEMVWDINFDTDTNVVEVAVRRLRQKIDEGFEPQLIHTVRGMGYVLDPQREQS